MALFTVTIPGVSPDPEVYINVAGATNYLASQFGPNPARWLALTTNQQGQTLRQATLYIDQQAWEGRATGLSGADPTTLAFPRDGLTFNGEPLSSTTVPPEVPQATAELAMVIAGSPDVTSKADQGNNISSVAAGGGVSVSYFSPTSARLGTATTMPTVVARLLSKFLATASSAGEGGEAGCGNSSSAVFSSTTDFNLGLPQ